MRFGYALPLLALVGVTACSPAYVTRFDGNNHGLNPQPVAPADVRVVKSRDDLNSSFTELGRYRGKAPTVVEAMDIAKEQCGSRGANFYVLNTEPFADGNGFRVDGVCALRD